MSTARGLAWFFFNTAFAKSLTFITQLVLGWLLVPEEFGLYAIAVSIGAFIGMMRNGGVEQVLIQKGERFSELSPTAFNYSLGFNLLAMFILASMAGSIASVYDDERLFYMLLIMSVVLPLGTPAVLYRAKLSVGRQYKELALQKTIAASVRQLMIVVLALNGFGVYSFVIPMVIEVIVEAFVGWYYTRWFPLFQRLKTNYIKELFVSCKWLMLASVMLALATTGDFFLLGLVLPKDLLGVYFFGLQLVVSVATIFSTSIQGVVMPALVSKAEHSADFSRMYTDVVSKIFFITLPVSVALSMLAAPAIHYLWAGRWDDAIPVAQVFFLGMPFWLLVFVGRSALEALGLWKKRLAYLAFYGLSSMLVAVSIGQLGNILYIAIGVAVIRACVGVYQSFTIFRQIKESFNSAARNVLLSLSSVLVSALLAVIIMQAIGVDLFELTGLILLSALFVGLFTVFSYFIQRDSLHSVYSLMLKRFVS